MCENRKMVQRKFRAGSVLQPKGTLSVVGKCLMTGERVVIPRELQAKVLKELHIGHPGIVRMKKLARSYVYWPSVDKDCEDVVKSVQNARRMRSLLSKCL